MKSTFILWALVTSAYAREPVLNRVTAETVLHLQEMTPMLHMEKPDEGKTETIRPGEQSIIKQSVILNDGTNWTLIPIGAVVYLPETMKRHVNGRPAGKLLPWLDFLTHNISWLTTTEVSFNQAAGDEPLPTSRVTFWEKQDKVVVAVHQNGPISVRNPNKSSTTNHR